MSIINEQPKSIEIIRENDLGENLGVSERNYHTVFYEEVPGRIWDGVSDKINRNTVMKGSSKPWDKVRLIQGKLKKLEQIGELSVQLQSSEGDKLSASHFLHDAFIDALKKEGAEWGCCNIQMNHSFFNTARPAQLTILTQNKKETVSCALISYSPQLEAEFYDPRSFIRFLEKARLVAVWKDTLEPIKGASWYNLRSRKQDILVVQKCEQRVLKNQQAKTIQIEEASQYDPFIGRFFNDKEFKTEVIRFPEKSEKFLDILEDLKINNSPWTLIRHGKESFLINKSKPLVDILSCLEELEDPLWSLDFTAQSEDDQIRYQSPGVAVLSMNQTNSYTQYTHEILTLLLSGMDVFAYDNAGKGLSEGSVSESGLTAAIYLAGNYLKEFGYKEEDLLFKGQCAGGLPSSKAIDFFPQSHLWIDQSPNTFYELAPQISEQYIQKQIEEKPDACGYPTLKNSMNLVKGVVGVLAKRVLPSFDIVSNIEKSQGRVFYSIGIPDAEGEGGDNLVPQRHTDQLIQKIGTLKKPGIFLPIVGGTHVTDWWVDPSLHTKVIKVLSEEGLAVPLFPSKTSQENSLEESDDEFFDALSEIEDN